MTETLRYSLIYLEDLAVGSGSASVEFADGRTKTMTEISLSGLLGSSIANTSILYINSSGNVAGESGTLAYDEDENEALISQIAGGTASGGDLTLDSTQNATKGDIILQPDGGNVVIGASTADEVLHVHEDGETIFKLNNTATGATPGDLGIYFTYDSASGIDYYFAVDQTDSNKLFIGEGNTIGGTQIITIDGDSSGNPVGIGSGATSPLGLLTSSSADPGIGSLSIHGDEFYISGTGNVGMTIGSSNTAESAIFFADPDDNDVGSLKYNHSSEIFFITVGTTEVARWDSSGQLFLGDTANSDITVGLTINQGANDNAILALKSSDVAHGMTDDSETDTFCLIQKSTGGGGGVDIFGFSESDTRGVRIRGRAGTENTTDPPTANIAAPIILEGGIKSGTTAASLGATGNLLSVANFGTGAVFVVKGDGELYSDQSATVGTFDEYDDLKLIKAFRGFANQSKRDEMGDDEYRANKQILIDRGVAAEDTETGRRFFSMNKLVALTMDAIDQQDKKIGPRLAALEASMNEVRAANGLPSKP